MKNRVSIAMLGVAAAAFALPASAQFYAGGGLGQSTLKGDLSCEGFGPPLSCDDKDTAWKIFAGYQANRNFAAELTYQDLGKSRISGFGASAQIESSAFDISALGILPFGGQLGVYGRLGIYYATTKGSSNLIPNVDETNTGLTYGIGLQWNPAPKFGVRVEWQVYNDVGGGNIGNGDINVLGISGLYRF